MKYNFTLQIPECIEQFLFAFDLEFERLSCNFPLWFCDLQVQNISKSAILLSLQIRRNVKYKRESKLAEQNDHFVMNLQELLSLSYFLVFFFYCLFLPEVKSRY